MAMMADSAPRRSNTPSTLKAFPPHTSTSPRQSGGVYTNISASSSALSFGGSFSTVAGSEVVLLPDRNFDGTVGLPPLTPRLSRQPVPESRPEMLVPAMPIQGNHPLDAPPLPPLDALPLPPLDAAPLPPPLPPLDALPLPPLEAQPLPPANPQPNLEEWKSWKIKYPFLSFLLVITISIIVTIITLDIVSRRNNGFAPLTSAPGFLARDRAIERAIWAQGVLYTSLPAFIMTLYRTMWESTVAAFADRQPYVDLKKARGRPAKATIMLDYKTKPVLWVYMLAFQNKHYLLGFCLLASVLLGLLVVPLVAFLFTTDSFASNTILSVSTLTIFDPNVVYPDLPDLRLSLNSAAAMRLQDARGPPWTDGEFAFPKLLTSTSTGDGNATIEATAYSSDIDCKYMPESDYTKMVVPPGTPGLPRATTIQITANDRGCEIVGEISVTTIPEFPDSPEVPGVPALNPPQNNLKVWSTLTCSVDSGWARLSMLTARHVNSSTGITNFSLISCIPSYRMTPGTLVATTSVSSELSLKTFTPHLSNMTTFRPALLSRFFELNIPEFNCFDQLRNVDADEFMRNVYSIAAKRLPDSPLLPEAIIDAASVLWSTTFAVLASTELFKPSNHLINGTGIHSVEVSRLIVVSPIAYIILSVLIVVALLNVSLFFYASQESILLEEPVGLVSAAGILHNSSVNEIVDELVTRHGFNGMVAATMSLEEEMMTDRYRFDENQGRIVRYRGAGIPRKGWWKSMIEWVKG
ncbi:uncharacterized protein PAC_07582 [Phialocephala subalpina]|uniref:Uncharacterized protein n=1 Tax=Phialocephala subalpina TaxID=576137 RepID=A0A1L7WY46_9HELO|nr:uncharacterized protein PAC_07582 [Phialocephala subalpina]